MEPVCKVALLKSRRELLDDLDVKLVTDFLLSKLVITLLESRNVFDKTSVYDQRRELLDMLPQKGPEAFNAFVGYLAETQNWLSDSIQKNLESVTQEELDKLEEQFQQLSGGGPKAWELQQVLRRNIAEYIQSDPSRILEEPESKPYINQPVKAHKIGRGGNCQKIPPETVVELLECCNSVGQRVFVYGAGGMGKSSLCRNIAETWAGQQSKLSKQFDFLFLIPMRAVRSHSLLDIICKDAQLIPDTFRQRILQELELKSVLFVFDSFEEMSLKTPEINRLIRRELYPKSSVLITARPGHNLETEEKESTPCIRADLQNLSEQQVKDYMSGYPDLQVDVQLGLQKRFGFDFLRKPINLWLLCLLVAQIATSGDLPNTQTILLNMIIQRLMMAFSKKKRLAEFDLTSDSPMENASTEVKFMLREVGEMCYFGLREKRRVLIIEEDLLSKADVLALGLFSEGADDNSVTLPHPLFQEYLAALFLSVNKRARQELLKELREESKGSSPRSSLVELLRPRGLDNTMRFLVGLAPGVTEDLEGLFVIKQHEFPLLRQSLYHYDLSYELSLLRECDVEGGKSAIAAALLKAPTSSSVKQTVFLADNTDSHLLLHQFGEEQCQQFLQKIYSCQICGHELIQAPDSPNFMLDSFVVGVIYLHNCSVRLKEAYFRECHVPVSMLSNRLVGVENLRLKDSILCEEPQFLASLNLPSLSNPSMPLKQQVVLSSVYFERVHGLNLLSPPHCTLPTTRRRLRLATCGEVNLGSLGQCFTGVQRLDLWFNKHVNTHNAGQWSSVRELGLHGCGRLDLIRLEEIFVHMEKLDVMYTALGVERRGPHRHTQWHSVKELQFEGSDLRTDEKKLNKPEATEFLTHFCPNAKINIKGYGLPKQLEQ